MIDISVQNVVKAFEEGINILDGVTFDIHEGEHVGLLGKNGAGKTTLFRLLVGELQPDEGDVVIPGVKKLGLISQIPKYPAEYTVDEVLRTAFSHLRALRGRMTALEREMEQGHDAALLREYDRLAFEFERGGGYETDSEVNRVANGLEIPAAQRGQLFGTLSGGEKTRVNLARLILENTDILLLDEPTNHLDMRATEWLEDYLAKYRGTVLIISHDRYFLDRAVTRTIEIAEGKAEFYGGNYSFYVEEKQRRYEERLKKYEREQGEIKRLQEAADRLYQWGTGNKRLMKQSFAIEKRIERMRQTDRPGRESKMRAQFGEKAFRGDDVLVMKGMHKGYDGRTLFSDVELRVAGGERIALIGDNGTGKSTLLRLILGEEKPDGGAIKRGPSVKIAYLPQIVRFESPHRSLLDTLVYEENCSPQTARNRLGAFKFTGEDVFKHVADLSGGEQSRLRLCILMQEDVNLLILDEPTNHLDIASREWIEEAVEAYEETLLFVSHDRYFIEKFATRIWSLRDGRILDFRGGFSEYRAYMAAEGQRTPAKAPQSAPEKKERPRKKNTQSAQKQVARLEREIAALEEKLRENAVEKEAFATDYEKLMLLTQEEEAVQAELEEKLTQWAELAE